MKKSRVGLLVAAALWLFPAHLWAQGKAAEGEAAAEAGGEGEGAAAEGGAAEGAEGEGAGGEAAPAEGADTGDGLADICKIDPAACPNLDMDKEAARQFKEPLYAVQQIYALRVRRFEINPFWSITLNDQFVGHPGPGVQLNYYITNVLYAGLDGNYYQPFNVDSDFNAQVRRAARVAVPLVEYQWSAALHAGYVFSYGKFAGFQDFIFHYDAYAVGGVAFLSARPIPVIDPDNRSFDYEPELGMTVGIGLRVFFSKWFGATFELRNYVVPERRENLTIAPNPADKSTWVGDKELVVHTQFQMGASIFIPFSFDYRLPK
jgi:outer membrane beta-barrel protein